MLKPAFQILFLLLLAAFISSCDHTPYGNNKNAGKYYNIRGFKMYCELYGEGEPLLMIHGNGGSISTFKDIIPILSRKYKVIVADSRSQGKSYDAKDSLSFEMMADDYSALLDQLHIDSAYVVGWSDGGINAILLAERHPGKVKKFVASGPNLWPDSTAIEPAEWRSDKKRYDNLKDIAKKTEAQKEEWKYLLLDCDQPHISVASLQTIKCPALIVGGDHDMVRQQHLKLIYSNIPKANLWIVPHSGHGTIFEHRYEFSYNANRFFTSDFKKDDIY